MRGRADEIIVMEVRMLQGMAGESTSADPGDIVDVLPDAAMAWIAAGVAEAVEPHQLAATAPPVGKKPRS